MVLQMAPFTMVVDQWAMLTGHLQQQISNTGWMLRIVLVVNLHIKFRMIDQVMHACKLHNFSNINFD